MHIFHSMKTVYLVASYTPTTHKQDILRSMVRNLKKTGTDIFLITHSHTPSDIISDVKYHFFDSENELLSDDELKNWYHTTVFDNILYSKDVIKSSTTLLPCTRNLYFGMFISKMMGYDCLHYIEYDNIITNLEILNKTNNELNFFDGVCYVTDTNFIDGVKHPVGSYMVFNLNSYSFNELLWDKISIISEFKKSMMVEKVTENLLINSKNFSIKPVSELRGDGFMDNIVNDNHDNSIDPKILFINEGKINLYCCNKNYEQIDEYIEVIINNSNYLKLPTLKPDIFHVQPLGDVNDIKYVKLYSNNKLVFEYDLSDDEKINKLMSNNFLS